MLPSREQFFKCYRPILFPMFATGCLAFRVKRNSECELSAFTKMYTYAIRAVSLGVIITGVVLKVKANTFSKRIQALSPLIQLIITADIFFTITTYISLAFQWEVKKVKHIQLYERAFELDTILGNAFSVNFNYHKTIRKNNIYIGIGAVYCGAYYLIYMLMLDVDWRVGILGIGYTLYTLGPGACSYGHMCLMDYLRVRYRLLQTMFRKTLYRSPKQEAKERRDVFFLLNCYQNYCEFTKDINKTYGHLAITNYFHDFTQISSMVFVLCHKAAESKSTVSEYIALFMFVLPRIVKIIYTAVYSRLAVKENNTCFHILAKYDIKYPHKEIKDQLDGVLWWRRHNNFDFTIGKALRSNFSLVFSMLEGIANYILILMQLKTQESSIEDRIRGKTYVKE